MRQRIWRVVGVALVVLVAIEGSVRFMTPRVPKPPDWHYIGIDSLVESMDLLERGGVTSDVVVAGTSLVQRIRVPIVERELESVAVAHNLSLFNAHTPVQRRWLLEEVLPRLKPDRVVWGVASLDFNGGRPQKEIEVYESSRAGKVGFAGPIDRLLGSLLMTVRYRQEVRGPLFFSHILDPPVLQAGPSEEPVDELLERSVIWDREQTEEAFASLRTRELHDFHIGEREAEDFIFSIEEMLKRDIEVILVLMPVPLEYVVANDEGRDSFTNWTDWVLSTAEELAVPVFDYSSAISQADFGDYIHLDAAGADLLTELLVEDLRLLGW